jgi:hypothetical protein
MTKLEMTKFDEYSGTIRELDNGKLIFGVELLDKEVEIGEVVTIEEVRGVVEIGEVVVIVREEDTGGTARDIFVEEHYSKRTKILYKY